MPCASLVMVMSQGHQTAADALATLRAYAGDLARFKM
jgi:hypothetical protein